MTPELVADNPTLALDAVGPSTPTVEHRQRGDAGVGQNTPEPRTAVGEGGQRRVSGSSDSVEIAADHRSDVRAGFGDGAEDLAAQGLMMLSGVDREHLRQHIRGRPVGHQGREIRLKPVQLRCRPAMRWPSNASLDPAARGTAKV